MYGLPDKYTELVNVMCENDIAVMKLESKINAWFDVK